MPLFFPSAPDSRQISGVNYELTFRIATTDSLPQLGELRVRLS